MAITNERNHGHHGECGERQTAALKHAPRSSCVLPINEAKKPFDDHFCFASAEGANDELLGELIGHQHNCGRNEDSFLLKKRNGFARGCPVCRGGFHTA